MTELSPRLQILFEKTRTVCFGRFVMQIPDTASLVYGPSEIETPIEYYPGDGKRISEHLAIQQAEIERDRKFLLKTDIPRLPLFGKVINGELLGQKIVFGSKDQAGYAAYSFIPLENDLFIQYIDSILPDEDIAKTFNAVASSLRLRQENDIPAEPGACIDGGFIPRTQEREWIRVGVRLKEFPDVHLSVDAHKNLQRLRTDNSPTSLRKQAKEISETDGLGAVFIRTKILRQQARQLSIWEGEELALRTPAYKNDKSVHEFRFHSVGAVNDPLRPELDIRFDTGVKDNSKGKINPSLTDEEALMLWDKLISTIRVRQPSDATPTKTASSRVPLASQVRTVDPCPQTGWWECTEPRKIEGDRRRLLKAGEVMPHVLLSDTSMWQKLTGKRSMHQIASVWKLVAYDEEPLPPTAG